MKNYKKLIGKLSEYISIWVNGEKILRKSNLFDPEYYLKSNKDVASSNYSPYKHFLKYGWKEGRQPSEKFDTAYYLKKYPDVKESGMNPLIHYVLYGKTEGRKTLPFIKEFSNRRSIMRIDVITVKHTCYVANLFKKYLNHIGIECKVHLGELDHYLDIPYIIICPQFIKHFPDLYFVMQMEQTASTRWLNDDYYNILNNAEAVFDYSLINIDFFRKLQPPRITKPIYYLPVDYLSGIDRYNNTKQYDVIFYGDVNNEHRMKILSEIKKRFNLKVISEVYGDELYKELGKAKVLVNLHYYEDALLETTRLYETLSIGSCVIVSEIGRDKEAAERLNGMVDFVPVGDVGALCERIQYWIENEDLRREKVESCKSVLDSRSNAFAFYFYRFLLAYGIISFDEFYDLSGDYIDLHSNRICLTLPESTERRDYFDTCNLYGFECFTGLRHEMGWIGCGLSYKMIFRKAMEKGLENIIVCEDDVVFKDNFQERLIKIQNFLKDKKWDVFSGLMADVGDVYIRNVIKEDGDIYVEMNQMISMVFNIYNRTIFEKICNWDETNDDVNLNTIDRFLEMKEIEVWTTVPFLVGHNEGLRSTIWNHDNSVYEKMIRKSETKLIRIAETKNTEIQSENISKQLDIIAGTLSDIAKKL